MEYRDTERAKRAVRLERKRKGRRND